MKINNEIIEEILCDMIGDDLPPLLHILLKSKPNLSEFKIAEKLNITVNQVRNMLYRMQDHNLVDFVRKKDKKKGWYIYYWTLNRRNVDYAIYDYKKKQIVSLKERLLKEETTQFFVCPMGCMRVNIDNAMEVDFRCQECGTLFKEQDNQRTIENVKRMIEEIQEEIKEPPKSMTIIHKDDDEEKPKKKVAKKTVKETVIKKVEKKTVKTAKKKAVKKTTKAKKKKAVKKKKAKKKPPVTKKVKKVKKAATKKKTSKKKIAAKTTTKKKTSKKKAKKKSVLKKLIKKIKK